MSSILTGSADAALPQDHADLLVELAITVHKNAIYPGTHPLLVAAVDSLARRLTAALEHMPTLSIGVARRQLIIEGVATDEDHPILRELASRLHRHQVGALRFTRGLEKEELAEVLATIAIDVGRVEQPLGLMGPEVLQRWRNARLFPLTFDQLELVDDGLDDVAGEGEAARDARTRAAQLWIGLARAALAREATAELPSTEPEAVARAIDAHQGDSAYDQVVVGYMLQIADELNADETRASAPLRDRVSRLVRQMEPRTLQRLLEMGGDAAQRSQFALNATHGLTVDAVIDVVRAAAEVSGQTISSSLVRMLSKLAAHADRQTGGTVQTRSDAELRDQVRRLISSWELADPNPDDYTTALDSISRHAATVELDGAGEADPERMLQLALEVSTMGPLVERAFAQLVARADLTPLLDLLETAPAGDLRDTLLARVVTPERLTAVLHGDPPNIRLADRLAMRLRATAVDPIIDLLDGEEERLQAWASDMLVRLADVSGPRIVERLPGAMVQAQRQLLHIIDRMDEWPAGFAPAPFSTSPDASVRREAVKLMLRRAEMRDEAITIGLNDVDERTMGIALAAALKRCPVGAVPILMRRADSPTLSTELRARAIRALAASGSLEAMRWIAHRSVKKHWLLRTPVLREKSPQLISSIAGLAAHWSTAPEAAEVLALVAKSKDADLKSAAARAGAA
ncbi:MAG TPA: hypothetical protein VFZ21_02195 [Gemmatimonadaceae bacterium]|jgi:hypothetical protein|nr:hypothetical protein [Gemmatimonadaceae bacterium]